ncbi:MAG: autotransporter domain-containing protein [Saezia sp.]
MNKKHKTTLNKVAEYSAGVSEKGASSHKTASSKRSSSTALSRSCMFKPTSGLCAAVLLALSPAVFAENISYPDASLGTVSINVPPWGSAYYNSLAPSESSPSNNTVTAVTGGALFLNAFGGYSDAVDVKNNSVTINDDVALGDVSVNSYDPSLVSGGVSASGAVTGNRVVLNDNAMIWGQVHGGHSSSGAVSGNSVVLNNLVSVSLENAFGHNGIYGGYSGLGDVTGNSVTLNDNAEVFGRVSGGFSESGAVTGNSVILNDNTIVYSAGISSQVYGGYSGLGDVTGNSVTLNNNTTLMQAAAFGGFSGEGDVIGNTVTLNSNVSVGAAFGGWSYFGNVTGNSLLIQDSASFGGFTGFMGSEIPIGAVAGGVSMFGNATHNTVTIKGTPNFERYEEYFDGYTFILYGGYLGDNYLVADPSQDLFTGNTLNLHTPITVSDVRNFEFYNFYLPASVGNGDTLLNLTSDNLLSEVVTNLNGTKIAVGLEGSGHAYKVGDVIHLIQNNSGFTDGLASTESFVGDTVLKQGVTLTYGFEYAKTDSTRDLVINSVQASQESKAFSEGRISGLAMLNRGSDFLVASGMSVLECVNSGDQTESKSQSGDCLVAENTWTPFAISSADSTRYNTGSHVDVDGVSLMAGATHRQATQAGTLSLGGFIEAGWGSYDSYNNFNRSASVHGSGNTNYYGAGVLVRHDYSNGLYGEGSARMGRVTTDFESNDVRDATGKIASYDSSSDYYSAHLGLGYLWQANAKTRLDLFSKYLWTRQSGDHVNVLGDPIKFETSNSHRLRAGLHMDYTLNAQVSPYLGAAYEYEFDGKSNASTHGYAIDAPSLKGSTGIVELGLNMRPTQNKALSVNIGVNGYVGKREGVSAQAKIQYRF